MKRVLVLVEGQTEERFVKDVLDPYLWTKSIVTTPKVVTTKRVKRGPDFKGGITDYLKVENDLKRLLNDSDAVAITTLIDYYALPSDFPGVNNCPSGPSLVKVRHVETEWERKINNSRFHAYLMIHEFEALLFAKPDALSSALYQPNVLQELKSIRSSFQTPEDINDNPQTAPSKRITQLLPGYQKTLHGPMVTKRVGLEIIRAECPHFNDWLIWFEHL